MSPSQFLDQSFSPSYVDMGQCSKATFSYGFALDEAQLVKLLFACRNHGKPESNTAGSDQTD